MKVGDYIKTSIYGRSVFVKVIAIHGAGAVDVVTKRGQYYRVTGLGV